MCYIGKCKYENYYGDCSLTGNEYKCPEPCDECGGEPMGDELQKNLCKKCNGNGYIQK